MRVVAELALHIPSALYSCFKTAFAFVMNVARGFRIVEVGLATLDTVAQATLDEAAAKGRLSAPTL